MAAGEGGARRTIAVEREVPADVGDAVEDVETPALVIDLGLAEENMAAAEKVCRAAGVGLRPHFKAHKCSALALLQVEHGEGVCVGMCAQKVVEAETLVRAGVKDVLLANQVIARRKLLRLARVAAEHPDARVSIVVDSKEGVSRLEEAAAAQGARISALVEVEVGQKRCGVDSLDQVLDLARQIHASTVLTFAGIQAYHGMAQHIRSAAERRRTIDAVVAKARSIRDGLLAADLPCPIVTGGGSGTFHLEAASGVFTEVQPGSYICHDVDYSLNLLDDGHTESARSWRHALQILGGVMSRNVDMGRIVLDVGLKATCGESGPPKLLGAAYEALKVVGLSDEHTQVEIDWSHPAAAAAKVAGLEPQRAFAESTLPPLGTQLRLAPGHCDPTCNLHDFLLALKDGKVAHIWTIDARSPGL